MTYEIYMMTTDGEAETHSGLTLDQRCEYEDRIYEEDQWTRLKVWSVYPDGERELMYSEEK